MQQWKLMCAMVRHAKDHSRMDSKHTSQVGSVVSRRKMLKTISIGGSAAALSFGMTMAVNAQTAGDDPSHEQ